MTIGIIGQGFVGSAVRGKFEKVYDVVTYDKDTSLSNRDALEDVVKEAKVIFVCVPTPMNSDGSCNTSIVENVFAEIDKCVAKNDNYRRLCVIKSTVPPGTTEMLRQRHIDKLDVSFVPEFLTEANAQYDFNNQDRIIIGAVNGYWTGEVFRKAFPGVPIMFISSGGAELLKYVTNAFLSMKVSFANEMYNLCKELDLSWNEIIKCAKMDDRLGKTHWNVPGPDGDFGYGGHCFPKDLGELIHLQKRVGEVPAMTGATKRVNDRVRNNRDWEQMVGRAVLEDFNNEN